jgi:hypothetical protein
MHDLTATLSHSRRDYDDIPASGREKLEFVWLECIAVALEGEQPRLRRQSVLRRRSSSPR